MVSKLLLQVHRFYQNDTAFGLSMLQRAAALKVMSEHPVKHNTRVWYVKENATLVEI